MVFPLTITGTVDSCQVTEETVFICQLVTKLWIWLLVLAVFLCVAMKPNLARQFSDLLIGSGYILNNIF
jgi:hypothetical protein